MDKSLSCVDCCISFVLNLISIFIKKNFYLLFYFFNIQPKISLGKFNTFAIKKIFAYFKALITFRPNLHNFRRSLRRNNMKLLTY